MTTENTVNITCDLCHGAITTDEKYVAAGDYGKDFHLDCVNAMSGWQVIDILNLDDIKVMTYNDWGGAVKAPTYYRSHIQI